MNLTITPTKYTRDRFCNRCRNIICANDLCMKINVEMEYEDYDGDYETISDFHNICTKCYMETITKLNEMR